MRSEFLDLKFPARNLGRLAIRNVTVVPMDSRRILPDHTVVIERGKITRLGPSAQMPVEDGMRVVDGRGLFLMPGLADMYTHYRQPAESPLYLAYGITTVRTSGNFFQLGMEGVAAAGEFPSPRMITMSPPIDGIGPTGRTDMHDGIPVTTPEEAEALVHHFADRGYHEIMPFSLLSRELLAALGEAAAERGLRLAGNCPNAVSWEEAVAAGMSGFQQTHLIARDHMLDEYGDQTYWDRFDPAPGTKLDFDKIRRLGGFLAEHQAWNLPTIAFHQRASRPVEISMADPSLRYVPQSTINDWETTIVRWSHRGRVSVEEWRRLARIRAEAFLRVVGIFHEEGAPQLTCTDGINPYNVQGPVLIEEIENFAKSGMGAFEALRCATSEAARFMGEADLWGTIAVGKRADMILLRANPLEDLKAIRALEAVFVNGYYLDRTALDSLLEQRAALAAKGAPPVAATTLPPPDGTGSLVEAGTWEERICGAEFGRVSYRHSRLDDGGWLIEERHAGANPRLHPQRRSSRLMLDRDMNVQTGEVEVESFVGTEKSTIRMTDAGYELRHLAIDGRQTEQMLAGPPRAPSDELSLSFVPQLIGRWQEATVKTLDADGPRLGAAELEIVRASENPPAGPAPSEGAWQVNISRPGQRASQTYGLMADGRLRTMTETTVLLWPRELRPIGPLEK